MLRFWKIGAWILLPFLIMISAVGCDDENKITEKELIEFCEKLESSIRNEDPEPFNDALFEAGLQKRIFEGYSASGGLNYILNQTLNHHFKLGDGILSSVLNGDFIFEVTRIYRDEKNNPWVVFRLFNGSNFTYFEYQFQKMLGEIRITEGYYYNTGQYLSETIRDLVFLEVGFDGKGKKDPLIKKYFKEGLQFYQSAQMYLMARDFETALEEFDYIDRRLLKVPFFANRRINILSNFDEEKLYENLKSFNALYPNEERFNALNEIQIFMHEGEVEKVRRAIHDLSKFVGNDAVLDYYEAMALQNYGNHQKAIFYFDKFLEQRPGLISGYYGKATSYILQKEYGKAALCIKDILKNFNVKIKELEKVFIDFPEFLESEEYQLWKKGSSIM